MMAKEISEDVKNNLDAFYFAFKSAGFELPGEASFLLELKSAFAFSDYVVRSVTRHPDILNDLILSGDLKRQYLKDGYSTMIKQVLKDVTDDKELGTIIRKIRMREMVRIAWRDLCGAADLLQTLTDLSDFSDACIEHVFSCLYKWHCRQFGIPTSADDASPQNIVVLGMGKLGARELNFSSDIDLIFAYPEAGHTIAGPGSLSNEEFFVSLSQHFLKVVGDKTSAGILFRVDMRLRPFGENGPLITSFNAMEEYYQRQGREWERYALIKARVVAGDKKAGRLLLGRLTPFIYRRYLDYGVYESLREMKRKITLEVKRKGLKHNIKTGVGGIREIEFFGQIFQLVRGGVEPELQQPSIIKVLAILARSECITPKVYDELTKAYFFLRKTENRLQEYADQQTHSLPSDRIGRIRLAASMGFANWEIFVEALRNHMACVHLHFNDLLSDDDENDPDQGIIDDLSDVWQQATKKTRSENILIAAGYKHPGEINSLLESLRNAPETIALSREGRNRLNRLMPLALEKAGLSGQPGLVFKRIVDLIKTIERRTSYIALLLENQEALAHIVNLANASPWIISYLARHPVLIDELLDPRTLYTPPEKAELKKILQNRMERTPAHDLEMQIEELNIFKQTNTLRVAASDVSGAFPLMKVSDYLSYIAEAILNQVLKLSWNHMLEKHGRPVFFKNSQTNDTGFAVVAYGKLGGLELGYGSDLDLIFIHCGADGQTKGGKLPIDTSQFYARLGQRIIHILTTHTRAGRLYDIDMRLRPSGKAGPLVSSIEAFKSYQTKKAWAWEHQALVRARSICGDVNVTKYFEALRKEVLTRSRDGDRLRKEIGTMRERMRSEHEILQQGNFDVKQNPGGIVDIEFLVQYLVLLHSHKHNKLVQWSDNVRQLETLAATGILKNKTSMFLKEVYLTYRKEVHKLNLQEKPAIVSEDKFCDLRTEVIKIWDHYFKNF